MNPKVFFVVYTLGLDARVLTGKYQIKISKNSEKSIELHNSLQLEKTISMSLHWVKWYWKSMQSKSDQNCQCGYGETKVFELESKSSKPNSNHW